MNAALARFAFVIDTLNEWVGRAVAWLTLATVVLMFVMVVLRYGFDWNSIALQESVIYLHALVFMAGIAYTLRHDEHVRVDIFYRQFSPRRKAVVNLLGTLFLLLPACVFILAESWEYVANSWALLEGSRQTGGLPLTFLLKSFIPLMAVLLILQGLAQSAHALRVLRGVEVPSPQTDEGDRL
jgi:TRAP-type mannitol/chloroaromatic compound transport system permease small subunit